MLKLLDIYLVDKLADIQNMLDNLRTQIMQITDQQKAAK